VEIEKFIERLMSCDKIDYETQSTKDGCTVRRMFYSSDRYIVDYAEDFKSEGWLQFDTDQDASYFGFWVNPKKFMTLSYCEGDWTLVECHSRENYVEAIKRAIDFYGEGFVAKSIDMDGTVTVYRQNRSEFLEV